MISDRELVERLRQRDGDALRLIYEKYKHDLLNVGTCMMASRTDAEDCLHDVIVALATNRAHLRPDGNLKGYLVTSMANRSRDRLRRKKRWQNAGEIVDGTDQACAAQGSTRLRR